MKKVIHAHEAAARSAPVKQSKEAAETEAARPQASKYFDLMMAEIELQAAKGEHNATINIDIEPAEYFAENRLKVVYMVRDALKELGYNVDYDFDRQQADKVTKFVFIISASWSSAKPPGRLQAKTGLVAQFMKWVMS